jgi:hypothetical protein
MYELELSRHTCTILHIHFAHETACYGLAMYTDVCDHAHYNIYTLHNRTYFMGLIFADSCLSAKTAKTGPHENFSLYGSNTSLRKPRKLVELYR